MGRNPGSRWKDWVNWVALTGGLFLGGLPGNVITGALLAHVGFAVQPVVSSAVALACGGAALLATALRLTRLGPDR